MIFQTKNFQVVTFYNKTNAGNMYVLLFENKFLIIDPCVDYDSIKNIVKEKKCVGVFLTHAHYDHFEASQDYIDQNFWFYMHANAKEKLLNNDGTCEEMFLNPNKIDWQKANIKTVKENFTFEIEGCTLKVIELLGHTNCSIGFLIDDCFFVGDCIFAGGNIGRYDLKTGSSFQTRATLRKLKNFDIYLNVFPGHGINFMLKDFWNK